MTTDPGAAAPAAPADPTGAHLIEHGPYDSSLQVEQAPMPAAVRHLVFQAGSVEELLTAQAGLAFDLVESTCRAAGVSLGDHDRDVLQRLCRHESVETAQVVAAAIYRAGLHVPADAGPPAALTQLTVERNAAIAQRDTTRATLGRLADATHEVMTLPDGDAAGDVDALRVLGDALLDARKVLAGLPAQGAPDAGPCNCGCGS